VRLAADLFDGQLEMMFLLLGEHVAGSGNGADGVKTQPAFQQPISPGSRVCGKTRKRPKASRNNAIDTQRSKGNEEIHFFRKYQLAYQLSWSHFCEHYQSSRIWTIG